MKIVTAWLLCLFPFFAEAATSPKFELREGDRVVFIGNAFVEREQEDGFIETMLTRHSLDRAVTFRNLGWSGDTIGSHLRPNEAPEPRQKYVPNLFSYVEKIKPTVIFISYGMMESFHGPSGLDQFVKDYGAVLDKLSESTTRIVIVSPIRHEAMGGLFPDPAEHNKNLKLYTDAIRQLARQRGFAFVDLSGLRAAHGHSLTSNGVHLNSFGYARAAAAIEDQLHLGVAPELPAEQVEALRTAIKKKNQQFWYFYRPMNSEYVYPGGTRFQDKLGPVEYRMDKDLTDFYALAEKEDGAVAELKAKIARHENIPAPEKKILESRALQSDPDAPDPEIERQSFKVADGFEVNLFAADPLIAKPIQMAFDARGRLWVSTTTIYPQIKPGETQNDKIIILEDTDGQGRANKATVFADDLLIPTGVLPAKDGCYTFGDTKVLFLHDRDGDGHADETETVFSGFGTEDSHHKAHVFRYGPGGNIYFNEGVFLHSVIETAYGIRYLSGNWMPGIFEYQPDNGRFDVYLANSVPPNPWGHYWNRWGFDFHIDSSGTGGSYMILQTAGWSSSAVPISGGHGKLAGAEIISGRHFPDDWQGNLIADPFMENRVGRWAFRDDGSGYALKQLEPLIVSTNNSFRPVEVRMGPDGALYIADWFNPLIGHMQYHFRDPGRDATHGRIWRVTAKNRPLVPKPDFINATVNELLDDLKAPEDYTRFQAKRVLAERPPGDVLPALAEWVRKLDANDPDYDHERLEALWTYQNLHVVEPDLLEKLLRASEPNARAAATAVLRYWHEKISHPLDLLATQIADENPRVRLEAVITLSHMQSPRAMELALRAVDQPMDEFLTQALKNTMAALKPSWQPAVDAGDLSFAANDRRLQFVLQNIQSSAGAKPLLKLLETGKLDADSETSSIGLITAGGSEEDLVALFEYPFAPKLEAKVLAGLARATRERGIKPPFEAARMMEFIASSNENIRREAFRLAGAVKFSQARAMLMDNVRDASTRGEALEALASIGGPEVSAFFQRQEKDSTVISAWTGLDLADAAGAAADYLAADVPAEDVNSIFKAFLQKEKGSELLTLALEQKKPSADTAKLGLRAMQSAGRQDSGLLELLSSAAGLSAEIKPLSAGELNQWSEEVHAKGDPARGEAIFHRADMSCLQCHAVNGAGGQVGPELSAVGSGSAVDYIIESILFPSKIIKDGYESIEVTTKDDDYFLGIKVRETKTELVLKDAQRPEIVILKKDIKEQHGKHVSLMPSGLAGGLTHAEFIDLVRFLSELGKPGAYANNFSPVVRRWQIGDGPKIAYSRVNGDLPLTEFPSTDGQVRARCQIEVTTPGKIQLRVNSTDGLFLWKNEKAQPLSKTLVLDLPAGVQTLSFLVNPAKRTEGLRAEFDDVPGSPARYRILNTR